MGVRLPSALIKQYELKGAIEIMPTVDGIMIRPVKGIMPLSEWDEVLANMRPPEATDDEWDITLGDVIG